MADPYASLTTCNWVNHEAIFDPIANIRSDTVFAQELIFVKHLLQYLDQPILICQSKEPALSSTRY